MHSRFWFFQPLLLAVHVGDTLQLDFRSGALKKFWEELFLLSILHQAEHLPGVQGDALDEIPLLLVGICMPV